MMSVSEVAGEVVLCAGWIVVGAVAALSRYKKALELGDQARGSAEPRFAREYHRGLFFGRAILSEPLEAMPEPKPREESKSSPPIDAAPSLANLAQALENAAVKGPKEPRNVAAARSQATSASSSSGT